MDTGAAVCLQCVFLGSISSSDLEIERRPYHRYCTCALHGLKAGTFSQCSQKRHMAFRKKQVLRVGSLSLQASEMPSKWSLLSASEFSSHSPVENKKHDESTGSK